VGEEIQLVKAERKETKRLKSLSIWHRLLRAMKDALSHLPRQARDAHHDKQAEEKAFLLILFSRRDLVVRVPLMIHVPWLPESFGKRTAALVELVDLFPTVASIGGLPSPSSVDGVDVSSLLLAPDPPALTASEADGGVDILDLGAAYHSTLRADATRMERHASIAPGAAATTRRGRTLGSWVRLPPD
jgi:hypothetical protein